MSYTGSKAQSGRGTVVSIGTTGVTPTFSAIGELKSSKQSGSQWGTDDVTNFESGSDQEFQTTIRDNGTLDCNFNRISADTGQVQVEAAFSDGLIRPFKIQLPVNTLAGQSTTGDLYTFNGLVVERDFDVEFNKVVSGSMKVKISGAVTLTVGS